MKVLVVIRKVYGAILPVVLALGLFISAMPAQAASATVRFAIIGDYGKDSTAEADVAALVKGWSPDFIITVGDNNYSNGSASTIDANVGKYYHEFIYPYNGSYGAGASSNRFFPALGNHDWNTTNAQPYLDYFVLPGNERYYDFVQGPVHFFVLDSDPHESDGVKSTSKQAVWLKNKLAASLSTFNIVILHHAPYSSSQHGSQQDLQWPYKAWGADAVVAGHDHVYERVMANGMPYFVNGLGGAGFYSFKTPISGSAVRYNQEHGAMLVEATDSQLKFQFITATGNVVDTYTVSKSITKQFSSQGKYDGWLLEAGEFANKGGAKNTTLSTFFIGDNNKDRQFRAILSFDTSGLPDNAVITRATLKIKRQGLAGTNPFNTHKGLKVDIRKSRFGSMALLQLVDFQSAANLNGIATFGRNPVNGWYKAVLKSGAYTFVNRTGLTQFRLRFARDDNDDLSADYLKFYSGNAPLAFRPKLVIEYYVP